MSKTKRRLLNLIFVLLIPASAHATWLDLGDGTYNVLLNCTQSSVISCQSSINGSIVVSGAGLSFMDFTVNGQHFSGDPTDVVFSSLPDAEYENSRISLSPFAFLDLRNNLSVQFGPSDHWWVYCNNTSPSTCQPNTTGSWTASPVQAPEPISISLIGTGILAAGLIRYRSTSVGATLNSRHGR